MAPSSRLVLLLQLLSWMSAGLACFCDRYPWGSWSACSRTCNHGTQHRARWDTLIRVRHLDIGETAQTCVRHSRDAAQLTQVRHGRDKAAQTDETRWTQVRHSVDRWAFEASIRSEAFCGMNFAIVMKNYYFCFLCCFQLLLWNTNTSYADDTKSCCVCQWLSYFFDRNFQYDDYYWKSSCQQMCKRYDSRGCNEQLCPINCLLTEYGPWSDCSPCAKKQARNTQITL